LILYGKEVPRVRGAIAMKGVVLGGLAALVAVLVVKALPDIGRYIRISRM
jgi:hypothetical protein